MDDKSMYNDTQGRHKRDDKKGKEPVEDIGEIFKEPIRHKTYAKLLHHTPIWILPHAIRKCTSTVEKRDTSVDAKDFGPNDKRLIAIRCLKLGRPFDPLDPPHESVLEHISYTFELFFSRTVLQELSRTRIGISLSVESTRAALKKLLAGLGPEDLDAIKLLIHNTGDDEIDTEAARQISNVAGYKEREVKNDVAKYGLPECFMTTAVVTLNIRSMRHLFALRTSPRALEEYRHLCFSMAACIPETHRFLFQDRIHFDVAPQAFLDAWPDPMAGMFDE